VDLPNINNLRFAPDGKLTALGYNGKIWLLEDRDGDGLEDSVRTFWENSTLTVPVGMCWSEQGLFVSSSGKVSLFPDANADGKADGEVIITTNWPPKEVASGNVDATGIARDSAGNLYFGLLTANYANPYQIHQGRAAYTTNGLRGTVQKWNPRTATLETVATGVRVPFQFAFNRYGDLFGSDQEGETWCPNGNPLDELNHIQPRNNYGFPPRHPEWLPNLVSEPPVVSFGPQHQSACGFVFNEAAAAAAGHAAQGHFGPVWWRDNLFLAGQSRGKIWRVQLVKTEHGYVGVPHLIARAAMLITDLAISPAGHLYLACHSGLPDWGTGPNGKGKIFRIRYNPAEAVEPVMAWRSASNRVEVAFARNLPGDFQIDAAESVVESGAYVTPADRFEVLKPPYRVVAEQEAATRRRSSIERVEKVGDAGSRGVLDLAVQSGGATLSSGEKQLWLPVPDFSTAQQLLTPTSLAWNETAAATTLQLTLPAFAEPVFLHVKASHKFSVESDASTASVQPVQEANSWSANIAVSNRTATTIRFKQWSAAGSSLTYSTATDPQRRAVPHEWPATLLARSEPISNQVAQVKNKELSLGDIENGRALFFSSRLQCAECHRIRGQGTGLGPDLSNLSAREPESLLKDIKEPSSTINPDYVGYSIEQADGERITGLLKRQGNNLELHSAAGVKITLNPAEVGEIAPLPFSLMPEGLLEGLKPQQVHDLLAFLQQEIPQRSSNEVKEILGRTANANTAPAVTQSTKAWRGKRVLLIANAQDHGPGEHDYPAWQTEWKALLQKVPGLEVSTAWDWPIDRQFQEASLLIFYYWNRNWTPEKISQLTNYLHRGGGVTLFHSAVISDNVSDQLAEIIGLSAHPRISYRHCLFTLDLTAAGRSEIFAGFPPQLDLLDEPYWPLVGKAQNVEVLATTRIANRDEPLIWRYQYGSGRVFGSIPGHYTWTWKDPLFRAMALRAMCWAMNIETGSFDFLVQP
jgi:putative heme-binding domain-containing protein